MCQEHYAYPRTILTSFGHFDRLTSSLPDFGYLKTVIFVSNVRACGLFSCPVSKIDIFMVFMKMSNFGDLRQNGQINYVSGSESKGYDCTPSNVKQEKRENKETSGFLKVIERVSGVK